MKRSPIALSIAMLVCIGILNSPAAIITQNTWSVSGSASGWTNSLTSFATVGEVGGALRMTGGDPAGFPKLDSVYDTDDLIGNYLAFGANTSVVQAIRFKFSPTGGAFTTNSLQLYFVNGANDPWYYDITGLAAGWNTYYANLDYGSGLWYTSDGSRQANLYFTNDLANVTQVGIVLHYPAVLTGQYYELDDFELLDAPIPEPGTYAVLAFALLSLGITFRRQLSTRFWPLPSDGQS